MRDEIARLVYPVLTHGLKLKERLARGEKPHVPAEQAVLKGLLNTATRTPPWGGDGDPLASVGSGQFLGIRYALACWLDEIFCEAAAPFGTAWDNDKLELQLFRGQLRSKKFWEQARKAEGVAHSAEALEAFLLCVYFGFRGELGEDDPNALREWVAAARKRVGSSAQEPTIPEKPFPTYVPPLLGADRYRQMFRVVSLAVLPLVLVAAILLVRLLQK
jgi:type VI secretion system protein ImpK